MDLSVPVGQSASFSVDVSGSPTYQWQRSTNGVFQDIPGATQAAYQTPVAAPSDDGQTYRVVVGTGTSAIQSAAATLHVLSAPTPAQAVITATDATLLNDKLAINLDSSTGSIKAIVDRSSQQNLLVGTAGYRAMWGLNLTASSGGTKPFADNNSSGRPTITADNSGAQSSLTLVWTGLNTNTGVSIPAAKVTVKLSLGTTESMSHWTFVAENLGAVSASDLAFPLISGIATLGADGADNRLAVPEVDGRLLSDPVGQRVNWGRLYPSAFMNLQLAAYYNSKGGFLLSTRDVDGYTKTLQWFSPTSTAQAPIWQAVHFLDPAATSTVALAYEVVVGVFKGDWTTAADSYRSWAFDQVWVNQAKQKTLLAWERQAGLGTSMCAYSCGFGPASDLSLTTYAQEQTTITTALGMPTLARLDGWEKYGAWYYGDWLPPHEGWISFDATAGRLHQQGQHLHVLLSGIYVDTATALWQTQVAKDAAMHDQNGAPIQTSIQIGQIHHQWTFMNPASTFWRQNLSAAVAGLAAHGVDSIQFDNWPYFDVQDDYSAGHPAGKGGNWQWLAWKQLLTQAQAAGRATNPNLVFTSEGIHELALPYLASYGDRDAMQEVLPFDNVGTAIPFFSYVYAPLIQRQAEYYGSARADKPDSYHRLALARALLRGSRPQLPSDPFIEDSNYASTIKQFAKTLATARVAYQRYFVDGTMLPAPSTDAPTIAVEIAGDGGSVAAYSGTSQSVLTSAWRAQTGETGIALTNIGTTGNQASVSVDFAKLGLTPGRSYSVSLIDSSGTSSLSTISVSRPISVSVGPLQVVLLELK